MSTSVKFFNSDMPGAPQCSGTAGAMLSVLDACLVTGFGLQTAASTSIATGVCTLTLPTTPAMQVGSVALVAGATPASLNGEQRVTAITANTVSFATAEPDGAPTGTITIKLAPAGWLKPFSGTNTAAYKIDPALHPDGTGIFLKVDDTTTFNARIWGYETLSDISTGTGEFPTTAQKTLYVFKSEAANAVAKPWLVVCDDRMVYVGVRHYNTDNNSYAPAWWCFGEFASKKTADPYRFVVSGNYPNTSSTGSDQSYSIASTTNTDYSYLARSYTALGGGVKSVNATWPSSYGGSGSVNAPLAYPNRADYGLYLSPADIMEQGSPQTLRGRLPGMLMIPHRLLRKICPDAKTAYLDSAVPGYPGRTIGFMPCAYSGFDWGVVAFDLTGPWEH